MGAGRVAAGGDMRTIGKAVGGWLGMVSRLQHNNTILGYPGGVIALEVWIQGYLLHIPFMLGLSLRFLPPGDCKPEYKDSGGYHEGKGKDGKASG